MLRMKSLPATVPEVVQALRLLMRGARAEKGFVGSSLYLDSDDENAINYEERWSSREDFEEQARTQRYRNLFGLMDLACEQPTLEIHFVSETRGLEYIAQTRGELSTFQPGQNQHQHS